MYSEKEFVIEFPADRDYIPIVQDFLKSFLNNFDFNKEFSEKAARESLAWLNTLIPQEKSLQAQPAVSFCGKASSGHEFNVEIKTTNEKIFRTSLIMPNSGDIK